MDGFIKAVSANPIDHDNPILIFMSCLARWPLDRGKYLINYMPIRPLRTGQIPTWPHGTAYPQKKKKKKLLNPKDAYPSTSSAWNPFRCSQT